MLLSSIISGIFSLQTKISTLSLSDKSKGLSVTAKEHLLAYPNC